MKTEDSKILIDWLGCFLKFLFAANSDSFLGNPSLDFVKFFHNSDNQSQNAAC